MLHSFHLYCERLEVLEGIPSLISHPRVRLGVCVQSWYAVAVMKVFFSGAKLLFFFCFFFWKSNQLSEWKSKRNLSYLFLRASLWFFTKNNTAASAHKDDLVIKHGERLLVCLFVLRRNGNPSKPVITESVRVGLWWLTLGILRPVHLSMFSEWLSFTSWRKCCFYFSPWTSLHSGSERALLWVTRAETWSAYSLLLFCWFDPGVGERWCKCLQLQVTGPSFPLRCVLSY